MRAFRESRSRDGQESRLREAGGEALGVLVAYVKQETLDPLKALGRFVAFGLAGAVLLSIGLVLLAVALLRALQGETGTTLTGNLSWVPYGCVAVVSLLVISLALWRIARGPAARRRPPSDGKGAP